MNIVVTGFAGLEGSLAIYENNICREKLLNRYSKSFFGIFENKDAIYADTTLLDELFCKEAEQGLAADAGEGGVLAALWKVLKERHAGGMYSQKDIPVLQQTIEVCEMFAVNPYRLHAPGCRVWLSQDTGKLMQAAAAAGVPCSVIGYTAKGVAIKRIDTEGDSSLRRPEEDELDKWKRGGLL